jgi:hypothetical protein
VKRLASVPRNSITKSRKSPGVSVSNATTIGAIHPLQPLSRARRQIDSFDTPSPVPVLLQGWNLTLMTGFRFVNGNLTRGSTMARRRDVGRPWRAIPMSQDGTPRAIG